MASKRCSGLSALLAVAPDEWRDGALMSPAELAKLIGSANRPAVLSVAFPVLYRQRHIAYALQAGPASKPEGMALLNQAAAKLAMDKQLAIYCGCFPMPNCPNIRPAYGRLVELGFTNVRVLNIPTNLHTDLVVKGYPSEPKVE